MEEKDFLMQLEQAGRFGIRKGNNINFDKKLKNIKNAILCPVWDHKRWFHFNYSIHFLHPNSNQPIRPWDNMMDETVCHTTLLEMQAAIREKIIGEFDMCVCVCV